MDGVDGIDGDNGSAGEGGADGKVYNEPVSGRVVDQVHGGAGVVAAGSNSCVYCHTTKTSDKTVPESGLNAGAMEAVAGGRGGVWSDTPTG